MTNETYNGWTNYETWNVALWIENDFGFYSVALICDSYDEFVSHIACSDSGFTTPDGVCWFDPALNHDELNEMLEELS